MAFAYLPTAWSEAAAGVAQGPPPLREWVIGWLVEGSVLMGLGDLIAVGLVETWACE